MEEKSVPKRRYTEEFKTEAARLAQTVGQHEAARRLGVPVATLGNWVRKHQKGQQGQQPSPAQTGNAAALKRPVSELEAENSARNWLAPSWISKSSERQRHTSRRGRGEVCLH